MQTQGLTQLSFESAEPPFDELPPAVFFSRFPETGVTALGSEFKFEIIVRTAAGNNAAVESCFRVR